MMTFLFVYCLFMNGLISDWFAVILCLIKVLDIIAVSCLKREYEYTTPKILSGVISAFISVIVAFILIVA